MLCVALQDALSVLFLHNQSQASTHATQRLGTAAGEALPPPHTHSHTHTYIYTDSSFSATPEFKKLTFHFQSGHLSLFFKGTLMALLALTQPKRCGRDRFQYTIVVRVNQSSSISMVVVYSLFFLNILRVVGAFFVTLRKLAPHCISSGSRPPPLTPTTTLPRHFPPPPGRLRVF